MAHETCSPFFHIKTLATPTHPPHVRMEILPGTEEACTIRLSGHLDVQSTGSIWREVMCLLDEKTPQKVIIDASAVEYCDDSGIALFLEVTRRQREKNAIGEIHNLRPEFQKALDYFLKKKEAESPEVMPRRLSMIESLGKNCVTLLRDIYTQIVFAGELGSALWTAVLNPRLIRWKDVWHVVDIGGVSALPIIVLLNFLMGLIMAFQAAIPMRQFGADVYVADLVGLSIVRELGPLMTAVILAGRSGSAFAAELGTMKVNEEIDALNTMGLHPVRFLVINRVLAVIIFTPILTLFADFAGLVGGSVVFKSLGYPMVTYVNQLLNAVAFTDFFGGFIKSFVFALFIASIGCLRGLETKTGASAVGISATRAVVSGLVLIVVIDGVFSVIYYYLGI